MSAECDTSAEHEDKSQYKKGGYHPVQVGDLFVDRYLVKQKIGWGQFSTVWLCEDTQEKIYVALKISKSALYYTEAAASEMDILLKISDRIKDQAILSETFKSYIVTLLNSFTHRGPNGRHVVMVFEILGINLLDVIKAYEYKGVPFDICKSFLKQILQGLDFIHRQCEVIHTDLKPENILLELTKTQIKELLSFGEVKTQIKRRVAKIEEIPKPISLAISETKFKKSQPKKPFLKKGKKGKGVQRQESTLVVNSGKRKRNTVKADESIFSTGCKLKIVDFGNAVMACGLCNNEIQTRQYRAPEVILGMKYTTAADMWSVACIAFELLTGEFLFQPNKGEGFGEDDDHLAGIWETLGDFPIEWSMSSRFAWRFFVKDKLKRVPELHLFLLKDMLVSRYGWKIEVAQEVSEFLQTMLQVIPENRITAGQCLLHPWLNSK